jgi:hypothetical protein
MPNTHYMQELTRRFYEYCLDNLAGKQGTPDPFIITVWKGKNLLLFPEGTKLNRLCRYSDTQHSGPPASTRD